MIVALLWWNIINYNSLILSFVTLNYSYILDVWLDQPTVMAKLKTMFTGYSKHPPFAFVFFGNFTSGQNNENTVKQASSQIL